MGIMGLLDGDNDAYREAIYGWGAVLDQITDNQKIRITWKGKKPKTGYAYLDVKGRPGIRLTRTSNRWYDLLQYHTPLICLEVEAGKGWKVIWERVANGA